MVVSLPVRPVRRDLTAEDLVAGVFTNRSRSSTRPASLRRDKLPAAMTLHEDIEDATPAWSLRFSLLVTVGTAVLVGFVGSCFLAILLWATDVQ